MFKKIKSDILIDDLKLLKFMRLIPAKKTSRITYGILTLIDLFVIIIPTWNFIRASLYENSSGLKSVTHSMAEFAFEISSFGIIIRAYCSREHLHDLIDQLQDTWKRSESFIT